MEAGMSGNRNTWILQREMPEVASDHQPSAPKLRIPGHLQ
jgi:hypothetical protein